MKIASNSTRVRVALVVCLGLTLAAVKTSRAAIVSKMGDLVVSSVTSGLGSAFQVGDVFSYTLSYDDSILDVDSDPDYGEFNGALTMLSLVPLTSRVGIWTPTGTMGLGSVYTEAGAPQSWSFDAVPTPGFGPSVNGYLAALFYMGFGGLPANGDTGDGQTLGEVTGSILNSVSMANDNIVELSFEQGLNAELVTFELTTFHAPEPSRALLLLGGLVAVIFQRRRGKGEQSDRVAGLGGSPSHPVICARVGAA